MILAVVPAAGKSTRMGRPKLILPFGGKTILGQTLEALRHSVVEHTVVVTGPDSAQLAPIVRAAGAEVLALAAETPDMRATLEKGLEFLQSKYRPAAHDWLVVTPADHPLIGSDTVSHLVVAISRSSNRTIAVPTFRGKRGHPLLLVWRHVEEIRGLPEGVGLDAYLRQHDESVLEVPVASAGIGCDVDTPEEYAAILRASEASQPAIDRPGSIS
jgi:molybdenum cofactor cytidylyltransferase